MTARLTLPESTGPWRTVMLLLGKNMVGRLDRADITTFPLKPSKAPNEKESDEDVPITILKLGTEEKQNVGCNA